MLSRLARLTAAFLAVAAVSAASAPAAQVPDITDADFLSQAAPANRFEIATGRLTKHHARSRAVRKLGKMFVKDHTAALAQGAAVAAKLGITPPAGLSSAQQKVYDRLRKLDGRAFDRAWIRAQRAAHVEAVALHLRAALTGDTEDVKTLAITALPVVSQHLGELNMM